MPFVPVVNFWSTRDTITLDELRAEYQSGQVWFTDVDRAALTELLGDSGFIRSQPIDAAAVIGAVKDGAMGLLRATEVEPSVRALGIDGVNLFGNERIADIGEWPLSAAVDSASAWDQTASWTMVSVGDIMLDRGVITHVNDAGGDKEYLFDGGTSRVTRLRCCSYFNYTYPDVERTGNRGLVRQMLAGADLTIGNLESAVLYDAPHHADAGGFRFTSDASWMPVLAGNGFDVLSTANNHSRDAGAVGLATAIEAISDAGMVPVGSGRGADAASPRYVDVNGVRVAFIACNAITNSAGVPSDGSVGSLNCRTGPVSSSIREAREQADFVVVFPHWGIEYELPAAYQYELSDEWIDAGADIIIGAHSHFPGGIYEYDGHVSMLSMGNFIFDQDFRQTTLMGLVPEMTFNGTKPVQIWVHPLLNVNGQPNFADPNTDGQWAFDIMKWQSRRLDWGGSRPDFDGYPMR